MEIERIDHSKQRNKEHFQLQTEFKNLVEEYDPVVLKIENLYQGSYLPSYAREDEAILKIAKNSFTELRMEADRERDGAFRGMIHMNKAAFYHFDSEVVNSARRLKILFDAYGNIPHMPLQEETAAIYNLLQELNGEYNQDLSRVKLEDWRDKLQQDNDTYQSLLKEGDEEEIRKTELNTKKIRMEVDEVFLQIIKRLEALMLLEGDSNYIEFVSRLNLRLKHYDDILAQRRGRNAAEEEEDIVVSD